MADFTLITQFEINRTKIEQNRRPMITFFVKIFRYIILFSTNYFRYLAGSIFITCTSQYLQMRLISTILSSHNRNFPPPYGIAISTSSLFAVFLKLLLQSIAAPRNQDNWLFPSTLSQLGTKLFSGSNISYDLLDFPLFSSNLIIVLRQQLWRRSSISSQKILFA